MAWYDPTTWFDRANTTPKIKASDLNRIEQGIVDSVSRVNHTGSQSADSITDGTTNKAYTATEKTKLAAITGTNTGDQTSVTGNAGTATALATSRKIDGASFNGTADISTAPGRLLAPGAYVTGNYYYCSSQNGTSTSATLGNGIVRVTPLVIITAVSITRLFAQFTVAGDASSIFRVGIWDDDGNGRPGTLVVDAGSISTGSGNAGTVATGGTPGVYEITVSQTLQPGLYWVGGAVQGVTTTQPTILTTTTIPLVTAPLGTSLPSASGSGFAFSFNATGAFGTASSPALAGSAARIGYKVA